MPALPVADSRTTRTHRALASSHARITARDPATIRTQIAVSQIAAPTGDERRRAEWVAARLQSLGLTDARIDAAGNVVASRPGVEDAPPVLVCAHLDTVFGRDVTLTFRRDGERLTGPGIGDNGRGLAAMLAIAEEIDGRSVRTRRPIVFVATTGEEGAGDLRGAKYLFAHLDDEPAAAIALDGAGDERIVHKALGSRRYRISYRGAGGHSWAAFGIPNAVHAARIMEAANSLRRIISSGLQLGEDVTSLPHDAGGRYRATVSWLRQAKCCLHVPLIGYLSSHLYLSNIFSR